MKRIVLPLLILSCATLYCMGGEGTVKSVLIVYGSEGGSTKEVVETMKGYLEDKGCSVEVVPADSAQRDFSGNDLIIIGSGIYGNSPHKNVMDSSRSIPRISKRRTSRYSP
jgi:flavodoxin